MTPKKNTFEWWEKYIIKPVIPKREPIGAANVRKVTI
jgi:hypothetical protein